jgi:hypothetical protein
MLAIRSGHQPAARCPPKPRILHPYPNERFDAKHRNRDRYRIGTGEITVNYSEEVVE